MFNRRGLFAAPKHAVLSLSVQAEAAAPERDRSQFEVLVRHLIYRFFHNELLASDDETKRVMVLCHTVGLPTLLVSLFLYPAYHAFPPAPYPRPFWPQVGDHYFYVMYSFVIMGAATVYEWDLLFPDILDIFVLSVLPISGRRLFFARVLALAIFLALVLVGTSILGTLVFPIGAGLPSLSRHLLAHAAAVIMSGSFTAATFLALQGILINTVGDRRFRRITPILQCGSIMLLLAVLLLYPMLSHFLMALLTSNVSTAVLWFPPFWFLGIYERILQGPATMPVFARLAHTACSAVLLMFGIVAVTYPLAYQRRVRQLIEGARSKDTPVRAAIPLRRLLHGAILRLPAQRAVFHFVSQTVLRTQRPRVMLALYSGLALALAASNMVVLNIRAGQIRASLIPYGIRAAVPIMAFWTVIGLGSILSAPIDRRGSWLFRVLIGRPGHAHIAGMRIWIATWALLISLATVLILHLFSPDSMRRPLATMGQILVAISVSLILTDIRLYPVRTIPFTHMRTSAITDFPLMMVRYFVLFPLFVMLVVREERWIEASMAHLLATAALAGSAHFLLLKFNAQALEEDTLETPPGDGDEFPQRLGLREH